VGLKDQQTAGREALLSAKFQMLVQDMISPRGGRTGWRRNALKGEKWVLLQAELLRELSLLIIIKNQAKLPTGSCVPCNFFPNTWLSVTDYAVFDAVVYLMLSLCLICFNISAQIPGHFFISWFMLMFRRKIPNNSSNYNFTMFHY